MNALTKWFLSQKPLTIFLLSFLALPIYVWLYSIIYQLDNKRLGKPSKPKELLIGLIALYPIVYFFFFIGLFFNLYGGNSFDYFDFIMPFHITAMLCGLVLMILGAYSYGAFEKEKGKKTYEPIGVFFMLWFYIVGIWVLQPSLNNYMNE